MVRLQRCIASVMLTIAALPRIVHPLADERETWDAGGEQQLTDESTFQNVTEEGIHFYTTDNLSLVMDCITAMSKTRKEELFSSQKRKVHFNCETKNGIAHFRSRRAAESEDLLQRDGSSHDLTNIKQLIWGSQISMGKEINPRKVSDSDSESKEVRIHFNMNETGSLNPVPDLTEEEGSATVHKQELTSTAPTDPTFQPLVSPSKIVEIKRALPKRNVKLVNNNLHVSNNPSTRQVEAREVKTPHQIPNVKVPISTAYGNSGIYAREHGGHGHSSGYGHSSDHGHSSGYDHSSGHEISSGYGHSSGYGKGPKYKPTDYKGPAYGPYDFLPEGKAKFSKKVKYGDDPVKESQKAKYNDHYDDKPTAHFGGFGGGGSVGYGHDHGGGGYGSSHGGGGYEGHGHGGGGYGHDHGGSGYGKDHGPGYKDDQGGKGYDNDHGSGGHGNNHGAGGYGHEISSSYGSEYKTPESSYSSEISYHAPSSYDTASPSYSAPTPSYAALAYSDPKPAALYQEPEPSYSPPTPTYPSPAPAPSYVAPEPSYSPPAPTYSAPVHSYEAQAPTYEAPAPTYEAPVPSYEAPVPSYEAPATTYEAPTSGYGGPTSSNNQYEHLDDPYNTYNPHDDVTLPEGGTSSYSREGTHGATDQSSHDFSSGTRHETGRLESSPTVLSRLESKEISNGTNWEHFHFSSEYPMFLKPRGLQPFDDLFSDVSRGFRDKKNRAKR
ncbi:hornerin-like [Macrobrachium nipponense]|uniref:hornerin-like n=1 Tax=Macrobrachium nipponense TaxID=159736 RepID=UPI0030C85662